MLFSACLGLAFSLCARDRVRADGPFGPPAFTLVLIFTGLVVLPVTVYLYLVHTAWSWLYLVDPGGVPGLAVVPVVVAHGGALVLSYYVGAQLVRADKGRAVAYATAVCGALFVLSLLIFSARLGSHGSYEDYANGDALGLLEVKLGYVLVALALGVATSSGFVIWELVRDSRRVRAR